MDYGKYVNLLHNDLQNFTKIKESNLEVQELVLSNLPFEFDSLYIILLTATN